MNPPATNGDVTSARIAKVMVELGTLKERVETPTNTKQAENTAHVQPMISVDVLRAFISTTMPDRS